MLEAGDAVECDSVEACVLFEGIQAIVQTLWLGKLAAGTNSDIAILQLRDVFDNLGVEEFVVFAAEVSRLNGYGYLLRKACTQ